MSKNYPRAKWVLPAIVDPPERVCYTIAVPKERQHIAAFLGALQNLGSGAQWADDEAHTAKDVAQVWREIIDNLCASDADALGDCCMECSPVNVPFLPNLEAGETRTFRVVVEAGEFNILPIVLKANQSLTVSDWTGQWRDSSYHPEAVCLSNWETPEGFVIGNDGGALADTFPTDALPEYPHMRVAMRVNNCGILTYHELSDPITFTVPGSVDPGGVFVEFFGNCPLDEDGEIASGFLGYGMICLKAIVSDPNLCAQFFTDFSDPLPANLDIVQGIIVDPSPIGAGPALRAIQDGPNTMQSRIEIALDGCTVRDFAFTYYREELSASFGSQCHWQCLDAELNVITSGFEGLPVINAAANMTIDVGNVPDCHALNLRFHTNLIEFGPMLYVDDVFVN